MKLGRSERKRDDQTGAADLGGLASLYDRGLLSGWFMRERLGQEMERSRRSGHLLSLVMLSPNTLGEPDMIAVFAGATAAQTTARSIDLVGWAGQHDIIAILPDADGAAARAAINRWQTEMWLKTTHLGGMKWRSAILDDCVSYASPDEALAAVAARLDR